MFSMWAHALWARATALAVVAPLLVVGIAPVSAGHSMTPAFGSEAQVDYIDDFQADAGGLPKLACLHSVPIGCFGIDTVRTAYSVQPVLDRGIDGTGRTIVIIDAFRNEAIRRDLANFDGFWNIPAPPRFDILAPFGVPEFDPASKVQRGFTFETAIDVEWAHAIAPGAALVVVEASSEKDVDLVAALKYAVDNNLGDVITQSFGEAESCIDPGVLAEQHAAFEAASRLGITVLASSGDQGAARQSCDGTSLVAGPSTPASDPEVTSVGGTRLLADGSGGYISETAWNTPMGAVSGAGSSGGGFSTLYRRPGYQAPFQKNNKARGLPDVAYNAYFGRMAGFITTYTAVAPPSTNPLGVRVAGGTSAGTPQWAGIVALADQAAGRRLGPINKALYHIAKSDAYSSAFHDITSGDNSWGGFPGYDAGPGWDAVTGLGTPNVSGLIPLLGTVLD
jgi:subtilase family serine protease